MHWLVEPGFWSNPVVTTALALGAVVAVVSAAVGVVVVVRGQSFAGHALTDVAMAGGAGASLVGAAPLVGFLLAGVLGGGSMEVVGAERVRDRDVATGVVLGAAAGLTALLLYFVSSASSATGSTQSVLFGSVFTVSPSVVPLGVAVAAATLATLFVVRRPLLLSSLSPELAAARGVRPRAIGLVFVVVLAASVALSALVIGAILSTALLVGPASAALRVARGLAGATLGAIVAGVAAVELGILASYDSFYWSGAHRSVPVSACVVGVVLIEVAASALWSRLRRARG
ncbi:MAG: metal ABC transporter permease [Acidimicrobiales bacterium]